MGKNPFSSSELSNKEMFNDVICDECYSLMKERLKM